MPIQKKTNPALVSLTQDLRKRSWDNEAPVWRDIASRLVKPTRNLAEVNLSRLDRYAKEGETLVVAGKVLAAGEISKKVTVAAYRFSTSARAKITAAGGECLTLAQLAERNPSGKNVRIMG